jgi:hypothetical protein
MKAGLSVAVWLIAVEDACLAFIFFIVFIVNRKR